MVVCSDETQIYIVIVMQLYLFCVGWTNGRVDRRRVSEYDAEQKRALSVVGRS